MKEQILKERYFWKDSEGNTIEDWKGLCKRVAKTTARDKEEEKRFFKVMHDCLFLPNTPALTNAGREDFTMSACFVLPVDDSIDGIYDTLKNTAIVHKMGGGTGFSFSRLRPSGDIVGTTKGIASGPCSFMKIFNTGTDVMKQGGTRRGANMGVLRVDHPDIMQFIRMKEKDGDFSNFNLSVAVTDEFLDAVKNNGDFALRFAGTTRNIVKARELWNAIIERAWANGEPGLIFIDTVNRANPTPNAGEFEATNPCGEQPLLPYEACVLGSVNLARMVIGNEVDWDALSATVRTGVVMLDNIIDRQSYPIPEIEAMHKSNRKVGLGVMGWADTLIMLGIHYASAEALELAEKVMKFITEEAEKMSQELAEKHGVFSNWEGSVWQKKGIPMRNAALTTIAPTGTISTIAGVNGGIEPVFDFKTTQRRMDREFTVFHPIYKKWTEIHGDNAALPDYFVKASDVPVEWHIKMQAAFQKKTHNAISKTINMPETATKEDVEKAYWLAYELGCKGITVYRDGSRKNQVISTSVAFTATEEIAPVELPPVCDSKRIEIRTTEGKVFVHVTLSNGKPMEVFTTSPVESKYDEIYDAFSRVFSIALRCGIPTSLLLKQLEDANAKYGSIVSPTAAITRAFRMLGVNGRKDTCPECGGILILEEGCSKCLSCGFSKC